MVSLQEKLKGRMDVSNVGETSRRRKDRSIKVACVCFLSVPSLVTSCVKCISCNVWVYLLYLIVVQEGKGKVSLF